MIFLSFGEKKYIYIYSTSLNLGAISNYHSKCRETVWFAASLSINMFVLDFDILLQIV